MKKNIDVIDVSSSFLEDLREKLMQENSSEARELGVSLSKLIDGSSSSLIIELEDNFSKGFKGNEIHCGDLTIYVNSRRVTRGNEEIFLTPKEFDILYFLAVNKGEVFTKEQIYQAVWEDKYMLDDSNIMAFIRKIRKKIEKYPDSPEYILTIWGIGYKFNDRL